MTSLDLFGQKCREAAFDKLLQGFALTAPLVDYNPLRMRPGTGWGLLAPDGVLMAPPCPQLTAGLPSPAEPSPNG